MFHLPLALVMLHPSAAATFKVDIGRRVEAGLRARREDMRGLRPTKGKRLKGKR